MTYERSIVFLGPYRVIKFHVLKNNRTCTASCVLYKLYIPDFSVTACFQGIFDTLQFRNRNNPWVKIEWPCTFQTMKQGNSIKIKVWSFLPILCYPIFWPGYFVLRIRKIHVNASTQHFIYKLIVYIVWRTQWKALLPSTALAIKRCKRYYLYMRKILRPI